MPGPPIYEDWWTGDWWSFEELPHPCFYSVLATFPFSSINDDGEGPEFLFLRSTLLKAAFIDFHAADSLFVLERKGKVDGRGVVIPYLLESESEL